MVVNKYGRFYIRRSQEHSEKIAELHETRNSVERQRNMSAKCWIQLNFGGDVSNPEILDLVKQSYEIVKAKYTKKNLANL